MTRDPLRGKSVVVTRAPNQVGSLRQLLKDAGADVIELPTIAIERSEDLSPLRAALEEVSRFSAVVFGSQNAVDIVAEEAIRMGVSLGMPIACVGKKTAAHLEHHPKTGEVFKGPILMPEVHRAEGLALLLSDKLQPLASKEILWPRAHESREALAEFLEAMGAVVRAIEVYRIVPAAPLLPPFDPRLLAPDAVLFMSGESLSHFFDVLPRKEAREILEGSLIGVIGPVTAERARELGVRVDVVPEVATAEALVEALVERFLA